ncbi:MAG: 2-C-methyl-D-erythritol 2,4-cyclodiphosphate synthase [Candidatus Aminicenantales bacterium]
MDTRIGLGYDLHRLAEGRRLVLGGIEIPFSKGLLGHSDADVLVHALIDALLGAAGEGDIGRFFPDDDPRFKDADSAALLSAVMDRLRARRLAVRHADCVVVAEAPLIGPHVARMKETLAPLLGLAPDRLGIKAKTNEGTGLIGEGGAIACWAVVLLESADPAGRL